MNQLFRKLVLVMAAILMIAPMSLTTLTVEAKSAQNQQREKRSSINMLGFFLMELPGNIKPEALNEKWASRRGIWLRQCQTKWETAQIATLLIELDSFVKETGNDPKWKSRRPGWISEVKAVTTNPELAKLMVEFSGSVKPDMFQPDWKNSRDGWVKRVQSAK